MLRALRRFHRFNARDWKLLHQPVPLGAHHQFLISRRCSAGAILQDADFVNDFQGRFDLHDIDHPDENFQLLWSRIEKFHKVVGVLDMLKEWEYGGMPFEKNLADAVLLKLSSRMWYKEARKVVIWLDRRCKFELTERDELIRLEIIRRSEARSAFQEISRRFDQLRNKSEQAYLIFLEACVTEKRILTAEKIMDELRTSKVMESVRPYNLMLKFYLRCGRSDKALALYRELLLLRSQIAPDFSTFCLLMRFREVFGDEPGIEEKAQTALECARVQPENRRAMLRLYGYLGKQEGVEAVWNEIKASPPVKTTDYLNALEAFDDLGRIERAEEIAKELEQKTNGAGFYQLITLLGMYARHGLMNKAEVMRSRMDLEGWKLDNRSWYVLVEGYLIKVRDFDRAVAKFCEGWKRSNCPERANRLTAEAMVKIMDVCGERNDVETAEALMKMLPATRDLSIYKALMRLYVRTKKPGFGIRRRMEDAKVVLDEECEKLLKQVDGIVLIR